MNSNIAVIILIHELTIVWEKACEISTACGRPTTYKYIFLNRKIKIRKGEGMNNQNSHDFISIGIFLSTITTSCKLPT